MVARSAIAIMVGVLLAVCFCIPCTLCYGLCDWLDLAGYRATREHGIEMRAWYADYVGVINEARTRSDPSQLSLVLTGKALEEEAGLIRSTQDPLPIYVGTFDAIIGIGDFQVKDYSPTRATIAVGEVLQSQGTTPIRYHVLTIYRLIREEEKWKASESIPASDW